MTDSSNAKPKVKSNDKNYAKEATETFLSRVKWNSVAYSDNVGVQFCLELEKLAGKDALVNFISRLSTASDMFRMELTENEEQALAIVRDKVNVGRQLVDAKLSRNAEKALFSRRTLTAALIGGGLGQAFGSGLNYIGNTVVRQADTQFKANAGMVKKLTELRIKSGSLAEERQQISLLLDKPRDTLSRTELERIADFSQREIKLNGEFQAAERKLAETTKKEVEQASATAKGALNNVNFITTLIGVSAGIARSLQDNVSHQSRLKFESVVLTLDQFVNYRLGRTIGSSRSGTEMSR